MSSHRRTTATLVLAAATSVVLLATGGPAAAQPPTGAAADPPPGFETRMVDRLASGSAALGGPSTNPAVSRTALLVAFASKAINLVLNDTNDARDIFVSRRDTLAITRVSVSSGGAQANSDSANPSIDSAGARIVYDSDATNLIAGDTNNQLDVFLRNTQANTTTRVSRTSGGGQANGPSGDPAISGNGNLVAFTSQASNLVPGDTNNANDIFVADLDTGAVSRVSVRTDGGQANGASVHPAISFDGRYVAYASDATNLVSSDTNAARDVFVHDRETDTVTRVSVHSNGRQADGGSEDPSIALRASGYVVAFTSTATNLVGNDTNGLSDVYVQISQPRRTVRASVHSDGTEGNGTSSQPAVSGASITGPQYVAFASRATNLVAGDTNNDNDVFRYDIATGTTVRWSVATGGGQGSVGTSGAGRPAIDNAGHKIAYQSDFANLESPDTIGTTNVFLTVDHGGS